MLFATKAVPARPNSLRGPSAGVPLNDPVVPHVELVFKFGAGTGMLDAAVAVPSQLRQTDNRDRRDDVPPRRVRAECRAPIPEDCAQPNSRRLVRHSPWFRPLESVSR
jgi:hypothetical protein